MNQLEIDQILRDTLADFRITRGEKKVLKKFAEKWQREGQLALVRSKAFDVAEHELIDPQAKEVVQWLEDVVKVLQPISTDSSDKHDSTVLYSPADDCSARIQSLIQMAQKSIDICVFTITDNRISTKILDAHRRGIEIRVISDDDKARDLGSDVDQLKSAGIELRTDDSPFHMHHKFAIFDGFKLITGSYNWTVGAARDNEENLIVTDDPNLVESFSGQFAKLWQKLA